MKIIVKKDWKYTFFEHKGEYILSVICGSVAIFEIKLQLNEAEKQEYFTKGLIYIEELAKGIQFNPNNYSSRNII